MEPSKIFARPAPGLSVPLPDGSPWPADGAEVALDQYVRRRIADGDLVEVPRPYDPARLSASELAQGRAALGDDPDKPQTPSGEAAKQKKR